MRAQEIADALKPYLQERHELSHSRKRMVYYAFLAFAKYVEDPFNMTRSEFVSAFNRMERDYKPSTWNQNVMTVRAWYKWRNGGEDYPSVVKRVKMKRLDRVDYVRTKIVTDEEVAAMMRCASHPRDRALIAFYRGTGCRLGEGLGVRMCDIRDLAGKGFEFNVKGKTGSYISVPVIGGYAAVIRSWLNFHPYRDVPEAPLWLHNRGDRFRGLNSNRVWVIFSELAKSAGVRHVHPHMMRHTQSSEDARNKIPASVRKKRHGWSADSSMLNVYEHLSDSEGTDIYLETFGIKQAEEKKDERFGLVVCVMCNEENSVSNKFCSRCGTVLDKKEAEEVVERQKLLDALADLLKDPQARKRLFGQE